MTVLIARRKFVVALAGAATWPLVARAQQGNRVRRIGVFQATYDENHRQLPQVYPRERFQCMVCLRRSGWDNFKWSRFVSPSWKTLTLLRI